MISKVNGLYCQGCHKFYTLREAAILGIIGPDEKPGYKSKCECGEALVPAILEV